VGAPKNTSTEIVDKINKEVNAALDDPKMKARLANLGGTVLAGSPADFGKLIAEDTEKWAKVIRAPNIKPKERSLVRRSGRHTILSVRRNPSTGPSPRHSFASNSASRLSRPKVANAASISLVSALRKA